jgi:hypothetical protein
MKIDIEKIVHEEIVKIVHEEVRAFIKQHFATAEKRVNAHRPRAVRKAPYVPSMRVMRDMLKLNVGHFTKFKLPALGGTPLERAERKRIQNIFYVKTSKMKTSKMTPHKGKILKAITVGDFIHLKVVVNS